MILTSIGRGFRLASGAALSYFRAIRDGMPAGGINDAHRSYAEQVTMFLSRYRVQMFGRGVYGDVRWWRGKRYVRVSSAGVAAIPGTSTHGDGLALDLAHPQRAWMFAHAAAYGWVNPAWAKKPASFEPWHWEYFAALDQHRGDRIAAVTPITTQEDDDMRYFTTGGKGSAIYELGPSGSWLHLTGAQWSAIGKPEATTVTPDELVAIASLAAQRRKSLA